MTRCQRHASPRCSRICARSVGFRSAAVSAAEGKASPSIIPSASASPRVRVNPVDAISFLPAHLTCRSGASTGSEVPRSGLGYTPSDALVHPLVHGDPEDPGPLPLLRDLVGG